MRTSLYLVRVWISILLLFITSDLLHAQTGTVPTGSDTSCTGGASLFQKTYAGSTEDVAFDMALAIDSGYVIVGWTNSFGNGDYDGLVMKVNKKGIIVWSKAMGGTGADYFYKVRKAADDGFIICGQTKSYGNTAGDAWLVKLDALGNLQWTKKYGDGNVNGEIAYDVIQMSDGGYAFCGSHRFGPGTAESFVTRVDNQGGVLWSKQFGNSGSDQAAGLLEDGSSLVVVGFYQGGSFYDSYMMKLDKSNGALQSINGYDGEGRSTWFNKIIKTSAGYQVFSLLTDSYVDLNSQLNVWNLNSNGTVLNARKLLVPGNWSISYGWLGQPDGGFISVNGENTAGSDLVFCKVNSSGTLDWSKKFSRSGKQVINNVVGAGEFGGYAAVGYNNSTGSTPDNNDVYMLRVDSSGNAGPCSGANTSDLTVSTITTTTPVPNVVALGNVTINNPAITIGVVNVTPVSTTACYYCQFPLPVIPIDTTCQSGTPLFQKIYTGVADDVGYEMALAADSGYVISGWTNSFGNGDYDGLVMKVNKKGNTVWSKAIGGTGYEYFSRIKRTSDDGFIICGVTKSYGNTAGDAWLVKIDAAGNVQWSKKYGDGNVNGEIAHDVIQMSDGGYALCGSHKYAAGTAEGFVIRTDNLGNATWSKQYGISGSDQITSLIEDGGSIVVVGFYQGGSFYDSYLMKLDKTNGAIQSVNGYDGDGRSTWFNKIIKTNSGYQVYAFLTDNFADLNSAEAVWNLNTNGTIQNARRLVIPGNWTISSGWLGMA
ncbi:MAG TPA: hypothetical protein VLJ68_13200, partial [Chitinophagaceae bacterium]|nr:hypothetical protein [Chitinophagaceae bacterium]